jgi:chemotaxis protein histidine kinase CheA
MSRGQFEELVDGLSAVLLTVDFGSKSSLEHTLARLEALDRFLVREEREFCRTEALAQITSSLRIVLSSNSPSVEQTSALQAQLEALTQFWYDEAKRWDCPRATQQPTRQERSLNLPDTCEPTLLAEFIANARLRGEELEEQIQALRVTPRESLSNLRRAIHTLKGEAGMVGLDELSSLLHATESYLESPHPVWDCIDDLLRVRDWIMDALQSYETGCAAATPAEPLIVALSQAVNRSNQTTSLEDLSPLEKQPSASALPRSLISSVVPLPSGTLASAPNGPLQSEAPPNSSPTTWDEQELDLLVEFLHESQETVTTVDQTLLELEQIGPDAERVNRLFRAFHTIKGVASFLRLNQIVELSHTTETMLDSVRSGRLQAETGILDLVFDATTLLRTLLDAVKTALDERLPLRKTDGVSDVVARIRATTQGTVPGGSILPAKPGTKIGQILVENGAISESQLNTALERQKGTCRRLGEELVSEHAIAAKVVAQALRGQNNATKSTQQKTRELLKVDLERVDCLVETIGELVIVESMVSNAPEVSAVSAHLRNYLGQFAKITRELQELGMCMRMVPLRSEFQKMARMVRDLTRRSNKQVRVELRGESTEMDRSMVEQIADPLVHLIRNAVDHGIELPAERLEQGKSETGTITLSAAHEAGSIVIELTDDGRGINRERVLQKAISQGLVPEGVLLSDSQIYDLLFYPGFSTAATVTEISGRGVGMDVVKRNIEAVRG